MTAWEAVSAECPCRILPILHRSGAYTHYRDHAGRIRCMCASSDVPPEWTVTEAQRRAELEEGEECS